MTPERIEFSAPGSELVADVRHADGQWAMLILHGWTGWRGGSSAALTERLLPQGVMSLAVDLPGHGESSGERADSGSRNLMTDAIYYDAAVAAYDQLLALPETAGRRILIVGTSFGGYHAACLVAKRPADALLLRVPANYQPYESALQSVHGFAGDLMVIEAGRDTVIPRFMILDYLQAHAGRSTRHELLKKAPHSISTKPKQLALSNDVAAQWLASIS